MAFNQPQNLNDWVNILTPALRRELQDAPSPVIDCSIWTDFAGDRLRLSVSYHLFYRDELRDGSLSKVASEFASIKFCKSKRKLPSK